MAGSIQEKLNAPSRIPGGFLKATYPTGDFDFAKELTRLLIERGYLTEPVPLEDLHKFVRPEDQAVDDYVLNQISKAFYETSPQFTASYRGLVKYIADRILKTEVIFQETPTIRFHFPVPLDAKRRASDGTYLNYHSDTMVGHPFEEINCWLPVGRCYGSGALQLSSLEDGAKLLGEFIAGLEDDSGYHAKGAELFFARLNADMAYRKKVMSACKSMPLEYGELILFDPRCIHATAENKEPHTRISLDFRMIPVAVYEKMGQVYKSQGRSGRTFTRGDVYAEKSSSQM